ncbi:MipA/OmpV family protein [uncultured Cohaesibacter sp.]|uniref:MipA/OmpV family protein n=1 Tax=uncultured Cohaesibacter sp. TaxID=1002546 RepID=UPI0029C92CBB|nr:MipA/OmpV family protein [uncultured Cohaesibacter sp.]
MAVNYTAQRARITCALSLLMLSSALPAKAGNVYETLMAGGFTEASYWDITLGGGLFFMPQYEGSDTYKALPLPYFDIMWNDTLFLSTQKGLGANLLSYDAFKLGASISYNQGRKESDSRSELKGMGNISGGLNGNIFVEYDTGPVKLYSNARRYFAGSKGWSGELGIKTFVPLAMLGGADAASVRPDPNAVGHGLTGPAISLGASAEWADGDYMQDYFGVNAAQSAASGHGVYNANAGFKAVAIEGGLYHPVGPNLLLGGTIKYKHLVGDAVESPVPTNDNQMSGSIFATYSF